MTSKDNRTLTRRSLLACGMSAAAGATAAACLGPASVTLARAGEKAAGEKAAGEKAAGEKAKVKTYTSAEFYDAGGKFLVDKARAAYYDMFRRFGNPISETLKKEMWILDFNLGDFALVGMAGIFWLNREDYKYFGHEIYLLPGQMIPEHSHVATDKGAAKMESWQPRRGMVYTFGEGEPTPELCEKIPKSQRDLVKSRHAAPLAIDEIGHLNRLTAWHFMVAGPEGALVTEYGTFHDGDGLRFSNPKVKL